MFLKHLKNNYHVVQYITYRNRSCVKTRMVSRWMVNSGLPLKSLKKKPVHSKVSVLFSLTHTTKFISFGGPTVNICYHCLEHATQNILQESLENKYQNYLFTKIYDLQILQTVKSFQTVLNQMLNAIVRQIPMDQNV